MHIVFFMQCESAYGERHIQEMTSVKKEVIFCLRIILIRKFLPSIGPFDTYSPSTMKKEVMIFFFPVIQSFRKLIFFDQIFRHIPPVSDLPERLYH